MGTGEETAQIELQVGLESATDDSFSVDSKFVSLTEMKFWFYSVMVKIFGVEQRTN